MKILLKINDSFFLYTMYSSGNWREKNIFTNDSKCVGVAYVEEMLKKGTVIKYES